MSYRVNVLLGFLLGANMNSAADQAIGLVGALYVLRRIIVTNASINLTTCAGGLYTGAGKTGTILVAAAQVYSGLTAAGKFVDLTLAAVTGTDTLTANPIYLSLTTPQGAAATADVYVLGDILH